LIEPSLLEDDGWPRHDGTFVTVARGAAGAPSR
jgi:hypothetical protein